jgi:hypothetical protein
MREAQANPVLAHLQVSAFRTRCRTEVDTPSKQVYLWPFDLRCHEQSSPDRAAPRSEVSHALHAPTARQQGLAHQTETSAGFCCFLRVLLAYHYIAVGCDSPLCCIDYYSCKLLASQYHPAYTGSARRRPRPPPLARRRRHCRTCPLASGFVANIPRNAR